MQKQSAWISRGKKGKNDLIKKILLDHKESLKPKINLQKKNFFEISSNFREFYTSCRCEFNKILVT